MKTFVADSPSWRFRGQKDKAAHNDCREHGRGHHDSPIQTRNARRIWNFVERQVGSVADHNPKRRPHL